MRRNLSTSTCAPLSGARKVPAPEQPAEEGGDHPRDETQAEAEGGDLLLPSLQLAIDRLEELARHGLRDALHHALAHAGDRPADLRLPLRRDAGARALGDERHQDLALGPAGATLAFAAQPVAVGRLLVDDLDLAGVG